MKSKVIFWCALAVSLGLAALCGYAFCTRVTFGSGGLESLIPAYILLLFLSIILGDLFHEGAHLLVGTCCKMGVKPERYRPFRTSSVNVFPHGGRCMRGRMIATASAGVLVNLACAVLGITALCVNSVPAAFCVLLPYSAYLFIVNAVPDDRNGAKNDGMIVWELITRSDSAKVLLAILRIQGMVRSGTQLKDIPEEFFLNVPQLPEDDINFIILTRLRYEYYLGRGNDSEAYKYLMRYNDLIEYLPAEYRETKHNVAKDE